MAKASRVLVCGMPALLLIVTRPTKERPVEYKTFLEYYKRDTPIKERILLVQGPSNDEAFRITYAHGLYVDIATVAFYEPTEHRFRVSISKIETLPYDSLITRGEIGALPSLNKSA